MREAVPSIPTDLMSPTRHSKHGDNSMSSIRYKVKVIYCYDIKDKSKARTVQRKLYGYRQTWKTKKGEQSSYYPGLIDAKNRIDQSTFIVPLDLTPKVENLFNELEVKFTRFYVLENLKII